MKSIVLTFLFMLFFSPALACDGSFVQEPVTEPTKVWEDTFIGFAYRQYDLLDGRTLTTIRHLLDVGVDPEESYWPFMYIVRDEEHRSVTYIDKVGLGNCYEIERYE
jgi:hypothetical protein